MEFLREILNSAGADTLNAFTVVPGFGGYFKDVKGVADFSPQKIMLTVGKLAVTVVGEGLAIGRYFCGDLFISGAIAGVSIE